MKGEIDYAILLDGKNLTNDSWGHDIHHVQ